MYISFGILVCGHVHNPIVHSSRWAWQREASGALVYPGGSWAAADTFPSHPLPLRVPPPRGAGSHHSVPSTQCPHPEVRALDNMLHACILTNISRATLWGDNKATTKREKMRFHQKPGSGVHLLMKRRSRTCSAASSAFTCWAKWASQRVCRSTAWPPTWPRSVCLSGVWMTSFLTLAAPVLQTATATIPEVAVRGRSTWKKGVWKCVKTLTLI